MTKLRAVLSHVFSLLAAGLLSAPPAHAQSAAAMAATLGTDSVAWERVLMHVVSTLSPLIVRAAADPAPQPWDLRLPADERQRPLLESQLRRILRARPATAEDSVVYTLELGPLRVVGDTARVVMRTELTRRCPGSTRVTGFGNEEEVLVPRVPPGFWGAARSALVRHSDRIGCERSPR